MKDLTKTSERLANNGLLAKIWLVETGQSKIFENWNTYEGITKEEFIEGLKWLCFDPLTADGHMTRELGVKGGKLHHLKRCYEYPLVVIRYEDGHLWETCQSVETSEYDEKWGYIHRNACASINCKDRI